jgi:hypothetical protein
MLDFVGTVVLITAIIVSINAYVGAMPITPSRRIAVSLIAGLWVGIAAALAGANMFRGTNPLGPPTIGAAILTPLIVVALAAGFSRSARAALIGIPMPLLIGVNVWRVGGAFFLFLAADGRLAGPFPYSAGWGDIITGVFALPVAWLASRRQGDGMVWIWNVFGTLDLVAALALGMTSANGSPLQLIHAGVGSEGAQVLPWTLIPTVLVPMLLISHGIVFAQLRMRAADGQGAGSPGTF